MRRVAPKVPISTAMLRHFAAITVVATVCLALFAHGENTQALTPKKKVAVTAANEISGRKEVNGLVIGSGTRLENNMSDADETGGGGGGGGGGGVGHLNNYYGLPPASGAAGAGSAYAGVTGPAGKVALRRGVPPPVVRDANGIPIPESARPQAGPPASSQGQPPRAATEADFNRMMELSRARTGRLDPDEVVE